MLSLYHFTECSVFPFILYSHDISILCLKSTTSGTEIPKNMEQDPDDTRIENDK